MLLNQQPHFPVESAQEILTRVYGLTGIFSPLPSERDQNFRVAASDGRGYVLKIANRAESRKMLEAEVEASARCATAGLCPSVVPTAEGDRIATADGHFVRLITLLPGRPMGLLKHQRPSLLADFGRTLGKLSAALQSFDHPAVHRDFHWDLANAERTVAEHFPKVADPVVREHGPKLLVQYRAHAAPLLAGLRQSVIHNDANDFNVIAAPDGESISGIVDFGDMVFSHTVNELAVALAYVALGKADPLAAMCLVVGGYHREFPLLEAELEALFSLASMRLSVSACLAAQQQSESPGNTYLGISQDPIRATLPKLAAIHPRFAHYCFREACGLEPVPQAGAIVEWIQSQPDFASVIEGVDLRKAAIEHIDFSAGSPLVSGDARENSPHPLSGRVFAKIRSAGAVLGAGGYDEARTLYSGLSKGAFFFSSGSAFEETRSIHLGIDLTVPAGTRICAFADSAVYGFEDAAAPFDYGPVVILRHYTGRHEFFTLYGHLDRQSLAALRPGQPIRRGECFARSGTPDENGCWWPHVHFQNITDMLDVPCNFNGAALPSQRRVWKSLCPDPNLILRIPALTKPATASDAELLDQRRAHVGANLSISYGRQPLQAVRGWMQYLYDENGRRYLDAYNNVPHVGHSHPRVVEAVSRQLATLNTNTRYLQHQLSDYAKALTATLPEALSVCYFTASGSEANELALRLARAYTGARDLLVMEAAYHGHTTTLIDISPYKHDGPGGKGAPEWVHKTPIPDVYRGEFKAIDPEAGMKYAAQVAGVIQRIRAAGRGLCGYIAETCPSVAGQILLPKGFLREVYTSVRSAGGVAIADEVQTGFGRIGTHFWAFEAHDVVPDIVVLGKPIANGYPMGAVVCRREIAAAFDNGMEFFSTFGGSTAAVAAAHATLRVTLQEQLQTRALEMGERLLAGLRQLAARHPLIGDVRGSGLFAGVELVRDHEALEPAAQEAATIVEDMRDRGILLGTDGPSHNVIKMRGPLQFQAADIDALVYTFSLALEAVEE